MGSDEDDDDDDDDDDVILVWFIIELNVLVVKITICSFS